MTLGLDVVRVLEAVDRSLHGGGVPVAVADNAPTVADGLVAEVRRRAAGRPAGEGIVPETSSDGDAARVSD
jgi:hypothetical protein